MKQILFTVAILAFIVSSAAYTAHVDFMIAIFSVATSWFVFGKMTYCLFLQQGHGVFKRKGIYGISVGMLAWFAVLGVIIVAITRVSWTFPIDDVISGQVVLNLKLFSVSAIVGYIAPFVLWVLWLHRHTFYGSEYDALTELRAKGYPDDVVAEKMSNLRKMGMFSRETI